MHSGDLLTRTVDDIAILENSHLRVVTPLLAAALVERQRLAIARSVLKAAPISVLDEAMSPWTTPPRSGCLPN